MTSLNRGSRKRWSRPAFSIVALAIAMMLVMPAPLVETNAVAQQGVPWQWLMRWIMHRPRTLLSWTSTPVGVEPVANSESTAQGHEIYQSYCSPCHGEKGGGDGWWSWHVSPRPRNFTRGIFRFKSTPSGTFPMDQDLFRTISIGVNGTFMPSWQDALPERERWALVSYVKTLAPAFAFEAPGTPVFLAMEPAMTPQQLSRGKELFQKNCVKCHGEGGYGDGTSARNMLDSYGYPIRPRNFHQVAEFKRGHNLRDIALAVATGNDGTPMPSFAALGRDDIWSVARFVQGVAEQGPPAPNAPAGCMGNGMGMGMGNGMGMGMGMGGNQMQGQGSPMNPAVPMEGMQH